MTTDNTQLEALINAAWEDRANLTAKSAPQDIRDAVDNTITQLNNGNIRVATRQAVGQWTVHQWIKKAVLLSFKLNDNELMRAGELGFFDKVKTKFSHLSEAEMRETGIRVVPPAVARRGSYIAKGAILMPSYVNIGAYVDEGTMVDTWAAVGSCAQIGKNVHLSGGVGIGGVLEPMQANPTIIEDNCFIGARSEVVEGVIVEENSVLSMGVYIGQSTPIYDRELDSVSYGRVPAGSPGNPRAPNGGCDLPLTPSVHAAVWRRSRPAGVGRRRGSAARSRGRPCASTHLRAPSRRPVRS